LISASRYRKNFSASMVRPFLKKSDQAMPMRRCLRISTSAADLKSLTHSRQNRVQGLQIESGTRIINLPVPITFRSS
jgi:hypothetical protein